MLKINWDLFNIKNSNKQEAFETLCLLLFCNKYNVKNYIAADFNQAGLETEPIQYKGKWYGFQSKYFDNQISYAQVKKSIERAINTYSQLDEITIYYNTNSKPNSSKPGKEIVEMAKAKNVKIKWFGLSAFTIALNQKNNLPIAELFFGLGKELDCLEHTLALKDMQLLSDNKLIELPVVVNGEKYLSYEQVKKSIDRTNNRIVIIAGMPGTGKSVYVKKLFYMYSGLGLQYKEQLEMLSKQQAIPLFINLKSAIGMSLEELVRNRKADCQLLESEFEFVYLFDGLDELPMERMSDVISCIELLKDNAKTEKIIISTRKMSANRYLLKSSIQGVLEYEIEELNENHIHKYFENYGDENKLEKMQDFLSRNPLLFSDIKDVLMINILWDTILELDDKATIMDVIERKVRRLVDSQKVNELALPMPKREKISDINKELSFKMLKKHSSAETIDNIYKVLEELYEKLDYKQQNEIVDYLATAFFADSSFGEMKAYAYQHKRYQEYFSCVKLYEMYCKDMTILRESGILCDREFLNGMFLKYMNNYYSKTYDVVGAAEISLLNTYLGNNKNWGADRPYYENLSSFTKAVAAQSESSLSMMLNDDALPISREIILDVQEFEKLLEMRKEESISTIPDRVEELIKYGMRNMAEFWKQGKEGVAEQVLENIRCIINIVEEKYDSEKKHINRALAEEKYGYYFMLLVIYEMSIAEVVSDVEKRQSKEIEALESEYEKAFVEVMDIALEYRYGDLVDYINKFTKEQFVTFLKILVHPKMLKHLEDEKFKNKVLDVLKTIVDSDNNSIVIAWAKYFGLSISDGQEKVLVNDYKILDKERIVDLFWFYKKHNFWAFVSNMYIQDSDEVKYIDTKSLYFILYRDYLKFVGNAISVEQVAINFCCAAETSVYNKNLNPAYDIIQVWGEILTCEKVDYIQKTAVIKYLLANDDKYFSLLPLLVILKDQHNVESNSLIDELIPLFDEKAYKERYGSSFDMSDNVDYLFKIAYLKADLDRNESYSYILKGLNEGVLRHGWRKDYIVDHNLVDAFEMMAAEGYMNNNEIVDAACSIVNMIVVLNNITDERWRGTELERVMRIVDRIDGEESAKLIKVLIDKNAHSNSMLYNHLKSQIARGYNIEEIIEQIQYFDSNEETGRTVVYALGVYLHLFDSPWYLDEKEALRDRILTIIERNQFTLSDELDADAHDLLTRFCGEYNVDCQMSKRNNIAISSETLNDNTKVFIKELKKCKSKKGLEGLYGQLRDYNRKIKLTTDEVWKLLVDKTKAICGDFAFMFEYFSKSAYPDSAVYSSNSRYMYMGLGYAIELGVDKNNLYNFIVENGGHDGFLQLLYAYAFIEDKSMCRKLFKRFMEICRFLVIA